MDYEQIESSQRQHHEVCRHNEQMTILSIELDFKLFSMLKPKLTKDGDEWCCMYGEDLMSGIAGFGKTPQKAITDWTNAWYKEI